MKKQRETLSVEKWHSFCQFDTLCSLILWNKRYFLSNTVFLPFARNCGSCDWNKSNETVELNVCACSVLSFSLCIFFYCKIFTHSYKDTYYICYISLTRLRFNIGVWWRYDWAKKRISSTPIIFFTNFFIWSRSISTQKCLGKQILTFYLTLLK